MVASIYISIILCNRVGRCSSRQVIFEKETIFDHKDAVLFSFFVIEEMARWMYLSIILCNRKERCSYKQVFEKEIKFDHKDTTTFSSTI
jgi:hypothetical protein